MHFKRQSDLRNLPHPMEKSPTLAAQRRRGPTKAPLRTRGVRRFRRKVLGKRKATWMKSSIILVEDQCKGKQAVTAKVLLFKRTLIVGDVRRQTPYDGNGPRHDIKVRDRSGAFRNMKSGVSQSTDVERATAFAAARRCGSNRAAGCRLGACVLRTLRSIHTTECMQECQAKRSVPLSLIAIWSGCDYSYICRTPDRQYATFGVQSTRKEVPGVTVVSCSADI